MIAKAAALPAAHRAHMNSCDGRWIHVPKLRHLQLTDAEICLPTHGAVPAPRHVVPRGSRHRRQGDPHGAHQLWAAGCCRPQCGQSAVWVRVTPRARPVGRTHLHNAVRDIMEFAKRSGISSAKEISDPLRSGNVPGDIALTGIHGHAPAGTNDVWVDVTIVSATCPSNVDTAVTKPGGAAEAAAKGTDRARATPPSCANTLTGLPKHTTARGKPPAPSPRTHHPFRRGDRPGLLVHAKGSTL